MVAAGFHKEHRALDAGGNHHIDDKHDLDNNDGPNIGEDIDVASMVDQFDKEGIHNSSNNRTSCNNHFAVNMDFYDDAKADCDNDDEGGTSDRGAADRRQLLFLAGLQLLGRIEVRNA
mmetsp:Transcript_40432/g.80390  ORF Transcript_40432/g.80390 Transcript_40432/m.80390 type:complete len:118 (-) Transcript_40432:233-586(-)